MRQRDQKYLRFTLRLADFDRRYVERLVREQRTTPANVVKKLVGSSRRLYEGLKELEQP